MVSFTNTVHTEVFEKKNCVDKCMGEGLELGWRQPFPGFSKLFDLKNVAERVLVRRKENSSEEATIRGCLKGFQYYRC
jgi:hypothetical protein